ncbi:uncharacterized protein LOC117179048 isoform X3 [Belonocnema kinseyi]|uniref:uncharacterized protein LOC117179048 isoform X3 n=1 Tax=Belonocnema kinseyi TaxID=2817044 RepID=UPI00143D1450|nr:uncharacterized protein LOC117179048 isoform X3 [Belonocnema kinseyi]
MMLVLLLCVIMKIAEFSVGRVSPPLPAPSRPPQPCCNKRKRRDRRQNRKSSDKCRCCFQKRAGKGNTTMEDPQTPGSDCNSNPATDPISQDLIGSEFVQDNSEYQWFIDSYRDGGLHVHPSVLSSLSASYTRDDLGYYDDLARNLDANLAEVDMESFRTADIHTLLTALPVMCTEPVQHSEGEESACSTTDTISICKSSLLFSPVKETPVLPPGASYSVDSLDCEDMLLTCQTNNKNNYTIAFEGSIAMYSDGSQDFEGHDKQKVYEAPETYCNKALDLKNILNLSMACSDSKIYTTWSNLKHSSINKAMTRHPSGNNNTIPNFLQGTGNVILTTAKRSQSLPDLSRTHELQQMNVPLNFSVDSAASSNHTGPLQSSGSVMSRSVTEESSDSVGNVLSAKKLHNMSLVKLFMKQKSMSAEGMSLTLDQSDSVSENGWPTSNSDSGTNTQIHRHNLNNSTRLELPENDFSINWVKTDHYTGAGETHKDNFSDIPKQTSTPRGGSKKESLCTSIEEFTDSTSKSNSALDSSHPEVERRPRSAWSDTREKRYSRTMGIQAITEVEDNGVQTSLVYPIPEEKSPSVQETLLDKKPIYVVYPNYTLPDLSFLNSSDAKFENVALKPQNFNKDKTWKKPGKSNRPFSCNDVDALKQKGFSHVKDWESLTFLLPNEYKKILHDVPEVSRHIKPGDVMKKPLFCLSPPMRTKRRTLSEVTNNSSSSSTATQPSSGYRGSSTLLTDSSTNQQVSNTANPLYLYRYDSASSETSLAGQDVTNRYGVQKVAGPTLPKRSISLPHGDKDSVDYSCGKVPPRPPLPRSILRKNRVAGKRCSMFEMGDVEEVEDKSSETNKRMSLPEPYYINNDLHLLRNGRIDDSDKDVDETEERLQTERLKEVAHRVDLETMDSSGEDVKQLEDFLKRSGFSSQSSDGDDEEIKLRSYVRKFLALRMNKDILKTIDMGESQKKTVSFASNQRKYLENIANMEPNKEIMEPKEDMELRSFDLEEKRKMIWPVNKAVDLLLKYWHAEPIRSRQGYNDNNECSQLSLGNLCPPLYAIMSDGLKPQLNSTFGPIANSVWQVVEASSQQGPLTKTLNELVQRINGEDFITEGMLKFHAFVFGLLNLRALDAWFAYLCTRESILRKHYNNNSLLVRALSCGNSREVVDAFLDILQPLAFCPFQLDLLYQYRQLHNSFGNRIAHSKVPLRNAESPKDQHAEGSHSSPRKARPRSCFNYGYDEKSRSDQKAEMEKTSKKRWSHLHLSSKFHFDRIGSEDSEEYTDSLEHSPLNRAGAKPSRLRSPELRGEDEDVVPGDVKFRKLQEKWEFMLGKEDSKEHVAPPPSSPNRTPTSMGKSKIPRLLTSPIKQTSNLTGIPGKNTKPTLTGIPAFKKTPGQLPKALPKKPDCRGKDVTRRTSRVDQDSLNNTKTHLTRPSSLPYKTYGVAKDKALVSPQRRAASTSLPRPTSAIITRNVPAKTPKLVRTLTHRYSSDDGHLAFSEGEKLRVILEVDNKWLLCARGERKGLVPRTCVHALQT